MHIPRTHRSFPVLFGITLLGLSSCGGGSGGGSGMLDLAVADTPVDGAEHVYVTFTGVQIQSYGASMDGMDMNMNMMDMNGMSGMPPVQEYDFAKPIQVDLLQQQGGQSAALINDISLPVGSYAWIRFLMDTSQSSITLSDGSAHSLDMSASDVNDLTLTQNFSMSDGATEHFVADFDLRQSITATAGSYSFKPMLRFIDTSKVGNISGSAANTLSIGGTAISDPACMPAAYLYSGANVTPVDINPSSSVQPLTTATLGLDNSSGMYTYTAAYLAPGAYTVAFACAAKDNPAQADSLSFMTPTNATVSATNTTMVNMP